MYCDFMFTLLTMLEPRFEPKYTIIFNELESAEEIIFVNKGSIAVGYEINGTKKYALCLKDNIIIGAYETTLCQRCEYIYTALNNIEGFFIRKSNWV